MELWIAAISAVVALASAVLSWMFAARSHALAERSVRDGYLERVRDWAEQSVDVVVGLGRLCAAPGESPDDFRRTKSDLLTRLSSQIEKGRWFFPNVLDQRVGTWKEAAYRGFRQPILDHLVEAFDAANGVDFGRAPEACPTLMACQRTFVSEVQLRLDPKRRNAEYQTLLDRYDELKRYVVSYSPLTDDEGVGS